VVERSLRNKLVLKIGGYLRVHSVSKELCLGDVSKATRIIVTGGSGAKIMVQGGKKKDGTSSKTHKKEQESGKRNEWMEVSSSVNLSRRIVNEERERENNEFGLFENFREEKNGRWEDQRNKRIDTRASLYFEYGREI